MLNILWPFFIIISIIYGVLAGNIEKLNSEMFSSIKNSITTCIELMGTLCFWNGIMKIAVKTSFINKITKLINPLINMIFPKIKKEDIVYKNISMNIVSNILGLGNAATPLGINAMKDLEKINKDKGKLTNEMKMFILINTASIQIIPTTVIAIRNSLGSNYPSKIIFPVWISSIITFFSVIVIMKLIIKIKELKWK